MFNKFKCEFDIKCTTMSLETISHFASFTWSAGSSSYSTDWDAVTQDTFCHISRSVGPSCTWFWSDLCWSTFTMNEAENLSPLAVSSWQFDLISVRDSNLSRLNWAYWMMTKEWDCSLPLSTNRLKIFTTSSLRA